MSAVAGMLRFEVLRFAAAPVSGDVALVELEGRFARRLLDAWAQGRSSLLERLAVS